MKLAVSNLAWPVTDDEAVARVLRDEGVTGVEIAPSKVWVRAPLVAVGIAEAYADWWRTAGCSVVAFQAILFGRPELTLFGDAVAALQQHLVDMGQLAARCGARVLVFGAPGNRKRGQWSMSSAMTAAARTLRLVADGLAPLGVHLCIEPIPPCYGCDFINTAAEAAVLADAVGHPNFGVHLDTAALALSCETSEAALAPVMRHVRHVHLSEFDLAPLGTSRAVPHAQLGSALAAVGYAGWFSVEMRVEEGAVWRNAVPHALAVARAFYGT